MRPAPTQPPIACVWWSPNYSPPWQDRRRRRRRRRRRGRGGCGRRQRAHRLRMQGQFQRKCFTSQMRHLTPPPSTPAMTCLGGQGKSGKLSLSLSLSFALSLSLSVSLSLCLSVYFCANAIADPICKVNSRESVVEVVFQKSNPHKSDNSSFVISNVKNNIYSGIELCKTTFGTLYLR